MVCRAIYQRIGKMQLACIRILTLMRVIEQMHFNEMNDVKILDIWKMYG